MTLGHVIFRVSPLSFVISFHHYFIVILNLEGQRATPGNIKQSSALARSRYIYIYLYIYIYIYRSRYIEL